MKKKIIALISGAVILIIAAGSIYGKSESGHKEGEPDVVGTFSVNRDENITVVANRGHIGDKEAFARELLQMYKDDSFYSTKFSTDRGYATSLDMNIYLWKEDIEDPICIQSAGQGPESLNLAACHNCALLPETCCEHGNRLLDRGVVVGTLADNSIGFFSELRDI